MVESHFLLIQQRNKSIKITPLQEGACARNYTHITGINIFCVSSDDCTVQKKKKRKIYAGPAALVGCCGRPSSQMPISDRAVCREGLCIHTEGSSSLYAPAFVAEREAWGEKIASIYWQIAQSPPRPPSNSNNATPPYYTTPLLPPSPPHPTIHIYSFHVVGKATARCTAHPLKPFVYSSIRPTPPIRGHQGVHRHTGPSSQQQSTPPRPHNTPGSGLLPPSLRRK